MAKPKKKPWLAGLLSFLVIGMGQIYNKKYIKGILLFIGGMTFSVLALTNYWIYLILLPIWVCAIYDAYNTAKKTITEEPYKHAVKITVFAFAIIFIVSFIVGYWTSSSEIQSKLDEFERVNSQFIGKLDEARLSLSVYDTITARNRISEAKLFLPDIIQKVKSICNWFSEKGLSSEFEKQRGTSCSAFVDLYELCYPKLLDSFYMLTYMYDNAKKLQNYQITIDDYVSNCNSWLNDYNIVRGTCNTLFKKANIDYSLEDFSKICKIS